MTDPPPLPLPDLPRCQQVGARGCDRYRHRHNLARPGTSIVLLLVIAILDVPRLRPVLSIREYRAIPAD